MALHGIAELFREPASASGISGSPTPGAEPVGRPSDLPPAYWELHAFASLADADLFEDGARLTARNDVVLVRPPRGAGFQWVLVARLDGEVCDGAATLEEAVPLVDHRLSRAEAERHRFLAPLLVAERASPKHPRRISMRTLRVDARTARGAFVQGNLFSDCAWPKVEIILDGAPQDGPWTAVLSPAPFSAAWDGTYGRGMDSEIEDVLRAADASVDADGNLCWPVARDDLVHGLAGFQPTLEALRSIEYARRIAWTKAGILASPLARRVREALAAGGSLRQPSRPPSGPGLLEAPGAAPRKVIDPDLERLVRAGVVSCVREEGGGRSYVPANPDLVGAYDRRNPRGETAFVSDVEIGAPGGLRI
jgi:hypothetical protein